MAGLAEAEIGTQIAIAWFGLFLSSGLSLLVFITGEDRFASPYCFSQSHLKSCSIFGVPEGGHIQQTVAGGDIPLQVHFIPFNRKRKTALLFTVGTGLKKIRIPRGETSFEYAELAISLPKAWPGIQKATKTQKYGWPTQWMFNIANYIHGEKNWLDAWTVIANGIPPKTFARGVEFAAWGQPHFRLASISDSTREWQGRGVFFVIQLFAEELRIRARKWAGDFDEALRS